MIVSVGGVNDCISERTKDQIKNLVEKEILGIINFVACFVSLLTLRKTERNENRIFLLLRDR